ncbi:DUF2267 domain-containing protein [Actinacidiphila sp. bgisy167]|uniref:DUF2267 domain-containing protein n=1 Tax=Actinacidiphila sp. bgisy167 TaxID=3413797 RepID=UPI003D74B55E
MSFQPQPARPTASMTFEHMVERVRYDGVHPTRERAEEAVRAVLGALGRRLIGDERVALAACLPVEAALVFTAEIPELRPITCGAFVEDLAARTGGTTTTARWDCCTVLAVVAGLAGPELITRILHQLPCDYAPLFGRDGLVGAA